MKLKKDEKGIYYIEKLSFWDLIKITGNGFPVCDECSKDLIGYENLVLVPILNEVYCKECAKKKLKEIRYYPEDDEIQERRVDYYCDALGIERKGNYE